MTAPFLDPIIYPGAPMQTRPGGWMRNPQVVNCHIGGEPIDVGATVRFRGDNIDGFGIWECRNHVLAGSADWIRVYHQATCMLGGERIPIGVLARWAPNDSGWECRDHVDGVIA